MGNFFIRALAFVFIFGAITYSTDSNAFGRFRRGGCGPCGGGGGFVQGGVCGPCGGGFVQGGGVCGPCGGGGVPGCSTCNVAPQAQIPITQAPAPQVPIPVPAVPTSTTATGQAKAGIAAPGASVSGPAATPAKTHNGEEPKKVEAPSTTASKPWAPKDELDTPRPIAVEKPAAETKKEEPKREPSFMTVLYASEEAKKCSFTPIGKKTDSTDSKKCQVAIATSADCFNPEKDSMMKKLDFAGLGSFEASDVKIISEREIKGRVDGNSKNRAMVEVTTACDKIKDDDIKALAKADDDGLFRYDENMNISAAGKEIARRDGFDSKTGFPCLRTKQGQGENGNWDRGAGLILKDKEGAEMLAGVMHDRGKSDVVCFDPTYAGWAGSKLKELGYEIKKPQVAKAANGAKGVSITDYLSQSDVGDEGEEDGAAGGDFIKELLQRVAAVKAAKASDETPGCTGDNCKVGVRSRSVADTDAAPSNESVTEPKEPPKPVELPAAEKPVAAKPMEASVAGTAPGSSVSTTKTTVSEGKRISDAGYGATEAYTLPGKYGWEADGNEAMLKELIEANRAKGIKTRVFVSGEHCPQCPVQQAAWEQQVKNPASRQPNTRYYVLKSPMGPAVLDHYEIAGQTVKIEYDQQGDPWYRTVGGGKAPVKDVSYPMKLTFQ